MEQHFKARLVPKGKYNPLQHEILFDTLESLQPLLKAYNLDNLEYRVSDFHIDNKSYCCLFLGVVFITLGTFEMSYVTSAYTGIISYQPLEFILLHEIAHHLIKTNQLEVGEDEEVSCDLFTDEKLN